MIRELQKSASRASQRQSENLTHSGTGVKNNTVKYGGKINGNDCKLSVNY